MCEYQLHRPIFIGFQGETFTVILPDDDFTYFAFHAKINEEIEVLENGRFNQTTNKMGEDKKWTVHIKNMPLNDRNTVYYWIHVIRNGKEYHKTGIWRMEEIPVEHLTGSYNTVLDRYIEIYDKIEAASTSTPENYYKIEADQPTSVPTSAIEVEADK